MLIHRNITINTQIKYGYQKYGSLGLGACFQNIS